MSTRASEQYGEYELTQYLAAGGMADLYLARSTRRSGQLVVKRIQSRYVELTRVVQMFIDEGRIAQVLDHPNIVRVVDVGQEGGTYFLTMHYIPGRDLLAVCRRGVEVGRFLPRQLAAAVIEQAARGLVYAHERRDAEDRPLHIVHCDISPGNIMLAWRGTVKIVDFGIARATIQLRKEDHSVAGKYNYMAPEQIRGEPLDCRADLFSLGVILYEITLGIRLFRGAPEQVMRRVIEEPIRRPRDVDPSYPAALEAIVMRALERDPALRYQSARALREELRAWLQSAWLHGASAPPGKRELARYLRDIFCSPKVRESEEFVGGGEDDDQIFDRDLRVGGVVRPLEVDPEEFSEVQAPLSEAETGEVVKADVADLEPPAPVSVAERADASAPAEANDHAADEVPPSPVATGEAAPHARSGGPAAGAAETVSAPARSSGAPSANEAARERAPVRRRPSARWVGAALFALSALLYFLGGR
jgi:serine/threonine protein kinase